MRFRHALLGWVLAIVAPAHAQEWPKKAVHIVVPFGAGGTADLLGRITADHLSRTLNQQFVVENRTGAGGMVGAQYGASAEPDGYTLTINSVTSLTLVPATNAKTSYDPLKDFTHIAYIAGAPTTLTVSPHIGVKTIAEFLAYAKAANGPLTFGTVGVGSDSHVIGAAVAQALGIKAENVPYRGSPQALSDMLGGHIAFMPFPVSSNGDLIREGKLVGLAVTSPVRMAVLPDVPTFKELGYPNLLSSTWFVLSGPAKLPADIVETLNRGVVAMLKDTDIQRKLQQFGLLGETMTPAETKAFVAGEAAHWKPMIEAAGLLPKSE